MTARAVLEERPLTAPLDQIAGAAIGFDSGDFTYLGEANAGAFQCARSTRLSIGWRDYSGNRQPKNTGKRHL